jgi:tetratricopeptide (TPR) repeat protein
MEFVEGSSLAQVLAGTPLEPRRAAELVEVLARAMQHAHERGVVHRDLKPANVLLASGGRQPPEQGAPCPSPIGSRPPLATPKITDFGLAKRLDAPGEQTHSGAVLGTPGYMAPEQASGKVREVGPSADIYALGAILYECLTGRPPFKAATTMDTLLQVIGDDPVAVRQLQPRVPRDLETICHRCLHKDPQRRYASALGLADDLRAYLEDRPIRARPAGTLDRLGKFTRRNRALVGGLVAVFVALVLGIVGTSLGLARALRAEQDATRDRDRAVSAEKEERRLLADSYAQAARQAMQRGDWRAALVSLDRALKAGHADEIGLRFDKARAWYATQEVGRAQRELEALARRKDLGAYEGPVLLWRGDIAWDWNRDDKALALVKRALKKKLAPADAEYARGLVASTSPEAIAHFERALGHDAFHRKANAMMGGLLLMQGKLDEADQRIRFGEQVFPRDPTFQVLRALLLALRGERGKAEKLLEQARRQVAAPPLGTARALTDLFLFIHQKNKELDGAPGPSPEWLVVQVVPAVLRLLAVQRGASTADYLLPLPPVSVRPLLRLKGLTYHLVWGNYDPVIKQLERSTQVHPEGMFHYARGLLLFQRKRWAEAEQAFVTASTTPSIAHVRKPALFAAAAVTVYSMPEAPGAPGKPGPKERARKYLRALAALGGGTPESSGDLVTLALWTGDVDLARSFLGAWEERAPGSAGARHARLAVELAGGAWGRVLELTRDALARDPKDKVALRYRDLALEKVKALAGVKPR